ncbi:hypothetical protein SARC_09227 [Sphaeroforma arctica JP610]|uniref:F-box domain-containing protein n=1 Tax=Sphaeroforma arctica JP610 TaxID=667725 RepID=A0A0L0FQQ5_9EUKA|nr:hypothetical protein SARC_09227 [Sphaeroforma arctica JP610]KNC78343.1 hypothetical protein SARC_09227 [Sphaeroforma arctica JP610]|eukprot:XP_014152245.1 hypothetical protein SARC_09227 [Sphaeroforma arctica JP610]
MGRPTRSTHTAVKLVLCTVELPSDILLRIFYFLPQTSLFTIAQVCKRWHNLTMSHDLWTQIDQNVLNRWYALKRHRTIEDFYTFLEHPRFARLEHLAFPRDLKFGEFPLYGILPNGELTSDTLSEKIVGTTFADYQTHNTKALVERLASQCKYIETLNLCNSRFGVGDMWNFIHLPNLSRIVAPFISKISSGPTADIVSHLGNQLTDLRFAYDPKISGHAGTVLLRLVAEHCPNLRVLCIALKQEFRNLYHKVPPGRYSPISDELLEVVNQCTLLRRLCLIGVETSDKLLAHIYARRCVNELLHLERLDVGLREMHNMARDVHKGLTDMGLLVTHTEYASVDASVFFGRNAETQN